MLVRFHQHSDYSKRDSIATISGIVERTAELGQKAWGLTDHGTTSGLITAYKTTREYNKKHGTNLKFIFGCEFYWIPNYLIKDRKQTCHLVLLAYNKIGYYNLLKLVTIAHGNKGKNPENYYFTMRITYDDLRKYSEGLIATSACLGGILNPRKDNGEWDKDLAVERLENFRDIFKDNFYLEIHANTMPEQIQFNKNIVGLANEFNVPLVCADDSHYVLKEDADTHRQWLGIDNKENEEDSSYYSTDDYFIHSEKEMREKLAYLGEEVVTESILNTSKIADQCNVEIEFGGKNFPQLELHGRTPLEVVKEKCREGWVAKIAGKVSPELQKVYVSQLEHEFDVLKKCDYLSYFLLTEDFISWCRSQDIRMGIGRGSVVGSLVAYLMDITRIDPIKYDLVFERFAHTMRVTLPDVDNDIEHCRREDAIKYLVDKYIEVYYVRTIGVMSDKSALVRSGQALNVPIAEVKSLSKMIKESLDDLDPSLPIVKLAKRFKGIIQVFSVHASAIMLFPSDPCQWTAIEKQGDNYVCAYEYGDLEEQGLLKLDVLGVKTLDAIHGTLNLVNEKIDIDNLPDDDELTFKMLRKGQVMGCFQIESGGMVKLLLDMKPTNVFDLVPLVALYRPATIKAGMLTPFVERRAGKQKVKYLHNSLEPILKESYGVLLYQEQTMKIVSALAGYTLGQADEVRRAIGKKSVEKMAKIIPKFIKDGIANGISESTMKEVAQLIEFFAGYGFNKSHSVAYGYTAYQTAYLKAHYPVEYYCSFLNAYIDEKQEKIVPYINVIISEGITILPPDSRKSSLLWSIEKLPDGQKAIRTAIKYIKGVGTVTLPITTSEVSEVKLPKNKVEALIKAGAFDWIGNKRRELLSKLYSYGDVMKIWDKIYKLTDSIENVRAKLAEAKEGTKKFINLKARISRYNEQISENEFKLAEIKDVSNKFEYNVELGETEVLGFSFIDPFERFNVDHYSDPNLDDDNNVKVIIGQVTRLKPWKQKNNKPMCFVTIRCPSKQTYDLVMFNHAYKPLEKGKVYRMSTLANKIRMVM